MSILVEISTLLQQGRAPKVKELVNQALADGLAPQSILEDGLLAGMAVIGEKFKKNEVFVPEVLIAARAMNAGVEILRPHLTATGVQATGVAVIGTVKGEDIVATMDGIIQQMHISQGDCFIKLELFTPVVLQSRVDKATLSILRNSRKLTVGAEDAKVSLAFASRRQNSDGTFDVLIAIDSDEYTYGQVVSGLHIRTGRTFDNVVRLTDRCVYQKGGSQWYVRQVTKDGIFIKEVEVEVVYFDGINYYLTGINSGEYFDSGYQIIAGG
jgi:hypothetical protein